MSVVSQAQTKESGGLHAKSAFEVALPASTSNLGAGFDCFGLALKLYLTIRATVTNRASKQCRIRTIGTREGTELPRGAENLIYRAMAYTARLERVALPPLRLAVQNYIPLSRGLGGSAAAIVGGVKLFSMISGRDLSDEKVLDYAAQFEGHPDNVAATLFGGFVVTCRDVRGKVIALKRPWPADLKVLIVSPSFRVETRVARDVLPQHVNRVDGVYNLQRSALFLAALDNGRYELLSEAMKDRLHQEQRQTLVPGLSDVLKLQALPGLVGVALSGAGPSVVALATSNLEGIAEAIAACFLRQKMAVTWQQLDVDANGCRARVAGT